jgi:hypothetical protein
MTYFRLLTLSRGMNSTGVWGASGAEMVDVFHQPSGSRAR